jgi:SPP1 family predicted phage head-tail adaptor
MNCKPQLSSPAPSLGDLTHQLRLEAPIRTPDDAGGATLTWALIGVVYADIRSLTGTEQLAADRLTGQVTHAIWLRYRDGLTPSHRLMFGPRRFDIRAVLDHTGRRRFLECRCEEVVT